jgi:hypothetical protein
MTRIRTVTSIANAAKQRATAVVIEALPPDSPATIMKKKKAALVAAISTPMTTRETKRFRP